MGIVAVKDLPKRKQTIRKSKYPFTPEEIQQAAEQLQSKGQVGCGPYEPQSTELRAGRSAAQRLKKLVCDATGIDPETVKTTAWNDDKGDWGALVLKDAA